MIGLPVGEPAPDFAGRDQHGAVRTRSDLLASGPGLLVFYPWAFTPVCGRELEELRDRAAEVRAVGVTVFAVSCDPIASLRAYDDEFALGVPLVSDFWPHGAIAAAYGVFDSDQGCARRSSYLIDADGLIRYAVHNPMGEARDIDAYLAAAAAL